MEEFNSNPREFEGVVLTTVFYDSESGFRILKFERADIASVTTLKGKFGEVEDGEHLWVQGEWKENPTYGLEFYVDRYRVKVPETLEGWQRFLGGGLIPGVGPALAKRIVDHFGFRLKEILDERPFRLHEVKGLGASKAHSIGEIWKKRQQDRDLILLMGECGLGLKMAERIRQHYGEDSEKIIREQPYHLMSDIRGIGFNTADSIAMTLGLPKDSPERIHAGLFHSILNRYQEGHTLVDRKTLLQSTSQNLDVPIEGCEVQLIESIKLDRLVESDEGVQLKDMAQMELDIANHLRLRSDHPPISPLDEKLLSRCIPKDLSLGEEQIQALHCICSYGFSLLTGGPGVGKTTVLKIIVEYFKKLGMSPVLAAPTGRAAQRMKETTGVEAVTLHRLLKVQPGAEEPYVHHAEFPLRGQVFIVDECSMIDTSLMHAFLEALPKVCHVILVGDSDQLPSVGPGQILADSLESEFIPRAQLEKVYRQAEGSLLVKNSHRLIRGKFPEEIQGETLSDFYVIEPEEDRPERIFSILERLCCERIPKRFGEEALKGTQILSPMKKGDLGTENLNEHIQRLMNPNGRPVGGRQKMFRVGDRVLQLQNNYDLELFNGDVGFVQGQSQEGLLVQYPNRPLIAYPEDQYSDITLAYAMTVHKAQGSEYPIVIMPLVKSHRHIVEPFITLYSDDSSESVFYLDWKKRNLKEFNRITDSLPKENETF